MKFATIRFALALAVFVAWLGWLLQLALSTAKPIVLCEPQFLVSSLDVIAQVDSVNGNEVTVREVHWPPAEGDKLVGKNIHVTNLDQCKEDWQAADALYILALVPDGKDAYRVAPLPRSPTFAGPGSRGRQATIYPVTPQTRMQLDRIQKPQARRSYREIATLLFSRDLLRTRTWRRSRLAFRLAAIS